MEEEVGGGNFGEIGEPPSQRAPAAGDAGRACISLTIKQCNNNYESFQHINRQVFAKISNIPSLQIVTACILRAQHLIY